MSSVIQKIPFILFLDIDGVVNVHGAKIFDDKALSILHELIRKIEGMKIVVSSAWRWALVLGEIKDRFKSCTSSEAHFLDPHLLDKTRDGLTDEEAARHCTHKSHRPGSGIAPCRGGEIQEWLSRHPDVTNYGVLDDVDSHLSLLFGKSFFQTDPKVLLTAEIADKIFEHYQRNSMICKK